MLRDVDPEKDDLSVVPDNELSVLTNHASQQYLDAMEKAANELVSARLPANNEHIRPLYYKSGTKIEVWDAIEDWGLGFLDGNVIKYVARHKLKENPLQDLRKARTYLDKLISVIELKETKHE